MVDFLIWFHLFEEILVNVIISPVQVYCVSRVYLLKLLPFRPQIRHPNSFTLTYFNNASVVFLISILMRLSFLGWLTLAWSACRWCGAAEMVETSCMFIYILLWMVKNQVMFDSMVAIVDKQLRFDKCTLGSWLSFFAIGSYWECGSRTGCGSTTLSSGHRWSRSSPINEEWFLS